MKVTVESCLKKVDNRFKLVLLAAKRAKDLDRGARPTVAREDDKSTIIAMREISEEAISLESLENITRSNIVNRNNEMQIEEEEELYDAETINADNVDEDDDIDDSEYDEESAEYENSNENTDEDTDEDNSYEEDNKDK